MFKCYKDNLKQYMAKTLAILTIMLLLCIVFLVFYIIYEDKINDFYKIQYTTASNASLTLCEQSYVDVLSAKGKIISVSDVYNSTISYYDTLISILVALLGLFAFISWFSIKAKAKDNLDEVVQKYLDSRYFDLDMQENLKKVFDQNIEKALRRSPLKEEIKKETVETVINELEKQKELSNETLKVD